MLNKVREVLLTQYIGAILVALLILQAATEVITRVVRIGSWLFNYRQTHSVFENPSASFRWDGLILSALSAILYLLPACFLARWLYLPATPTIQPDVEPTPISGLPEQP